jgi:hypothetical protein
MLPDFSKDGMLKMLLPGIKQIIDPAVINARQAILRAVAGPMPKAFVSKIDVMYNFAHAEKQAIWEAAIDGAAEALAND